MQLLKDKFYPIERIASKNMVLINDEAPPNILNRWRRYSLCSPEQMRQKYLVHRH